MYVLRYKTAFYCFSAKVEIEKPLEDQTVKEYTESATFTCSLTRPADSVIWMKDSEPIEESSKYKITKDKTFHQLVILDINKDDKGVYSFKADDAKSDAELDVEVTSYRVGLKDIECREFEPVTLACEVTNELAAVSWFKDGQEVKESPRVKFTVDGSVHTLTISEACLDDEAEYTCKVGDVTTSCELLVESE